MFYNFYKLNAFNIILLTSQCLLPAGENPESGSSISEFSTPERSTRAASPITAPPVDRENTQSFIEEKLQLSYNHLFVDEIKLLSSACKDKRIYQFFLAVAYRNKKKIHSYLRRNPELLNNILFSKNPLVFAAQYDYPEIIELFVTQFKADVNWSPHFGYSALRMAVREGNVASVKKLLELGANPEITDQIGMPTLQLLKLRILNNEKKLALAREEKKLDQITTLLAKQQSYNEIEECLKNALRKE